MSQKADRPQSSKVKSAAPTKGLRDAKPIRGERQSQFTLKMRESLHHELARKALDSGMTMRGFIMHALKKSGLGVKESDLVDRRRR